MFSTDFPSQHEQGCRPVPVFSDELKDGVE